jgi:hypothetical protein
VIFPGLSIAENVPIIVAVVAVPPRLVVVVALVAFIDPSVRLTVPPCPTLPPVV